MEFHRHEFLPEAGIVGLGCEPLVRRRAAAAPLARVELDQGDAGLPAGKVLGLAEGRRRRAEESQYGHCLHPACMRPLRAEYSANKAYLPPPGMPSAIDHHPWEPPKSDG